MLEAKDFLHTLTSYGIEFFSGVPCSYLTPLINTIINQDTARYVSATSEGEALAMASGAWLSGKMGAVMCQNSGLGNMVNPLTSLNEPFHIPVLLLITWRGHPDEVDEPQHQLMGKITPQLLDLMQIPWSVLPETQEDMENVLRQAWNYMSKERKPYALLVRKECIELSKSPLPPFDKGGRRQDFHPTREEVLTKLLHLIPEDSPIIATTGKTGRELFTLKDSANHLYCVGSMGYANALGHGIVHKRIILSVIEEIFSSLLMPYPKVIGIKNIMT